MMDRYDDTPLYDVEAQRRVDRDLEQEEWEEDDTRIQPDPRRFTKRVIRARVRYLCQPCECGGQCEACAA